LSQPTPEGNRKSSRSKQQELHLIPQRILFPKQKKLQIISVFREPIERHISSFFQYYGTKALRSGAAKDISDTILMRLSTKELHNKFIDELLNQSLAGFREAITTLQFHTSIDLEEQTLKPEENSLSIECELALLHIFRFDKLFSNYRNSLETLARTNISETTNNTASSKWYNEIYREFKSTLRIPKDTVIKTYEPKRQIINTLYHEGFNSLLEKAVYSYS
tara:strand:+ start:167 stop:829 length:663 start_codon:yes stop_codon:yes gene_type:complete